RGIAERRQQDGPRIATRHRRRKDRRREHQVARGTEARLELLEDQHVAPRPPAPPVRAHAVRGKRCAGSHESDTGHTGRPATNDVANNDIRGKIRLTGSPPASQRRRLQREKARNRRRTSPNDDRCSIYSGTLKVMNRAEKRKQNLRRSERPSTRSAGVV